MKKKALPIYKHEYVLGADIGVWQKDGEVANIIAFGERGYISKQAVRYVSAWARRNLFEGAGPNHD